jgi:hypothetical protein
MLSVIPEKVVPGGNPSYNSTDESVQFRAHPPHTRTRSGTCNDAARASPAGGNPEVLGPNSRSPAGPLGLDGSGVPYHAQEIRQRRSSPRTLANGPRQLANRQRGHCPVRPQGLESGEDLHVHPVLPKQRGGTDELADLRLAQWYARNGGSFSGQPVRQDMTAYGCFTAPGSATP